jgi:glycosyltransferase involved in cell wall biosynthesis
VEIIPGSVDPARFQSRGRRRTIDLVFIGRIVPIKQPDHLVEIIRRVARSRPELRVVIAGRGPLLETMKRRVREEGLSRNFCFAGHVEKVEGLLARSRIFLLTSKSEGLSIALAEAMLAGAVPVVANVGDLGELVVDGQTGWLVPSGDFDAHAAKIRGLLEDPEEWEKMSEAARRAAFENNAVETVVRRWRRILPGIAGGAGAEPAVKA